jgi:hypothetical protein
VNRLASKPARRNKNNPAHESAPSSLKVQRTAGLAEWRIVAGKAYRQPRQLADQPATCPSGVLSVQAVRLLARRFLFARAATPVLPAASLLSATVSPAAAYVVLACGPRPDRGRRSAALHFAAHCQDAIASSWQAVRGTRSRLARYLPSW